MNTSTAQFLYHDEAFGFAVFAEDSNLYYSNGCEVIHITHYTTTKPDGCFELYFNGRFRKYDDLSSLAYDFIRSEDMEW